MDKAQQALFEQYAILQAHVNLLSRVVTNGDEDNVLAQIERCKQAATTLLAMPRPQQKAA